MPAKRNFLRTKTLKILLALPLLFIMNKTIAMEKSSFDKLQKNKLQKTLLQQLTIKSILIKNFGLSEELSRKIDTSKLPLTGFFEYFKTKDGKEIIYAIPFTIIAGANSYQEIQQEMQQEQVNHIGNNSGDKKHIFIKINKKNLEVIIGNKVTEVFDIETGLAKVSKHKTVN